MCAGAVAETCPAGNCHRNIRLACSYFFAPTCPLGSSVALQASVSQASVTLSYHQRTRNDVLPLCADRMGTVSSSMTHSRARSDLQGKERKTFFCVAPGGVRGSTKHTQVGRCRGAVRTYPRDSPSWQLGLGLVPALVLQSETVSAMVSAALASGMAWGGE